MEATVEPARNWNEIKRKLKLKFANLTESDVFMLEGKQDEVYARLQLKLGISKEELQALILEM